MTECPVSLDRMVEVARGPGEWTAQEEAHLAACRECRAAWQLARTAARLGAGVPRIDADRLALKVRARLREEATRPREPAGPSRWRPLRWAIPLAAAAALALAIGLGRGVAADGASVVVELDDLDGTELELLAEVYPEPLDVVMPAGAVGLSDLTSAEMERILVAWEG